MGDRVARMRRGKLQQVAPPQIIYRDPANLFVASFIGSPSMNFVRAEIVAEKDLPGPLRRRRHPGARRERGAACLFRKDGGARVRPEDLHLASGDPAPRGVRCRRIDRGARIKDARARRGRRGSRLRPSEASAPHPGNLAAFEEEAAARPVWWQCGEHERRGRCLLRLERGIRASHAGPDHPGCTAFTRMPSGWTAEAMTALAAFSAALETA